MSANIFALTRASYPYPPYLSVNRTEHGVEVLVRSAPKADGTCGDSASIELTASELIQLFGALTGHIWPDCKKS